MKFDALEIPLFNDKVIFGVVVLLLLMSVASWTVFLFKLWSGWRNRRSARRFFNALGAADSADGVRLALPHGHPVDSFSRLAAAGLDAGRFTGAEALTRRLRNALRREAARLESGSTILASTGSTAPFIGLFGTVWGIYQALIAISASGRTTLEAVAGPVGEALIVTAIGLAVAVPAVLAYNFLVRRNRLLQGELDGFAQDLREMLSVRDDAAESPATAPRRIARADFAEARGHVTASAADCGERALPPVPADGPAANVSRAAR